MGLFFIRINRFVVCSFLAGLSFFGAVLFNRYADVRYYLPLIILLVAVAVIPVAWATKNLAGQRFFAAMAILVLFAAACLGYPSRSGRNTRAIGRSQAWDALHFPNRGRHSTHFIAQNCFAGLVGHQPGIVLSDIDPVYLNALLPDLLVAAPIDGKHDFMWSRIWRYDRSQALALVQHGLQQSLPVYALFVSTKEMMAQQSRLPIISGYQWTILNDSGAKAVVLKLTPAASQERSSLPGHYCRILSLCKKLFAWLFFGAVIFLASYLRITGLAWGLESGYAHYRNFQPDEFISLRGVLEIDLLHSHIRVPSAYFEGTFNYYLWAIPKAALKLSGRAEPPSAASTGEEDHASLLYICRWMTLLFDLATIIIVFLAIREATQNFYASFLGACVYAVLPMQVIYAHFMRTHILGNLLCALVIWISLKLRTRQRLWLLLSAGFISGLGAATRYPVGIISVIPCLYLLFDRAGNLPDWRIRIWEGTKHFVAGPIWSIAAGFVIGLFFGHPMLFLDSGTVIKSITDETLKYASLQEFKSDKLLNLYVVWRYVSYLIPFAMYPLLWLIPYCAILYLGSCNDAFVLRILCACWNSLQRFAIAAKKTTDNNDSFSQYVLSRRRIIGSLRSSIRPSYCRKETLAQCFARICIR